MHSFVEINIVVLANKLTAALKQRKTFVMCQNNERNLGRYFLPQGSTDMRNDQLKQQARDTEYARTEMLDIYGACSGGGDEPVYMGDGLWISSNGRVNDWGR